MTKFLVLIGDGMSDLPLKELGGRTPLEAAKTPNMDFLAKHGVCGLVNNVPPGLEPGSDVAAMSIFGYDAKKYYTGRGPLEAASLGVELNPNEVAFRCNLVTIENGRMKDFTADHISTAEAKNIFKFLNAKIGSKNIRFYPGLSYRNLLVMRTESRKQTAGLRDLKTTPPHDITGRAIGKFLPKGRGAERLVSLMNESEVLLHQMKSQATTIWPWGQGEAPKMPAFRKKFKKKAAVITAVHLLKGLGKIIGMKIINVPGATGYLDTNYRGKAEYALRELKRSDVVFVHVEAPDEAGHEGDARKKIRAIEDFDKLVVGTILLRVRGMGDGVRVLVLPDHPTPCKLMTHTSDAVPFVIYPSRVTRHPLRVTGYNEKAIKRAKLKIQKGHELLAKFLGGKL
ncbi:cofactor-independent phosphoglycerate mutase [candidate division WOR-1 bacterium RIFCSPHIGHO2_01_FULL_53_15]|uniref:Cofactor-independent phosphoglycerate mutase n=1 Tax=candidate division WOR-1 bacterium RIFCSPHIGHO2_01_FULL_53_15 TaxID=1802564 RepID=A0A1F4Q0B1_UNCSA|nr:MAG: cofactor-independent phosphoglycerate mutase [candidate division WOR-1 bacterium RIFCSPHIGHO2_01_FULL_53_15]OGC12908.1 MAG: cofactor-independent phosphoglycerate mutase [candidate division WOR-1 bacterium RIFCSPHIGHO2_02_FULL_53_26]